MSHSLILGMTESGKTTLAKILARNAKLRGRKVIVLDPTHETWEADFQTADNDDFLQIFWSPEWLSCDAFIDESGDAIGQYDKIMFRTATVGRKQGHNCYYISQRGAQLSPTVRGQCSNLFLFAMAAEDCKVLANNWNRPELANAWELPQGSCYFAPRFGDLQLLRVF